MTPNHRGGHGGVTVEQAFGAVLRELRERAELSQQQLGKAVDSGRTYVSELERGIRAPTLRWIFRIAEFLDTSPTDIIRRVEHIYTGKS